MTEQAVALVLGGGGGIGSALTRRLAGSGYHVVVAGRRREPLEAVAAEVGAGVEVRLADATDPEAVDALVEGVTEAHGRLDAAASAVGSLLLKPAHRTSVEEYRDVVATNLDSAFFLVRAATKAMQRSGGSIALVSSVAGRFGMNHHEAIAAAKAGVEGLVVAAAASYAARGIRVNAVAPGLVATPMTERLTSNETSRKVSEHMHPLGRLGEPDDIASALAWLLDPANGWVTGQVLGVDGGMGTVQPRRTG